MRDFPDDALAPYGIKAQHPDEFLCYLLEADPELVCAAAEEHRQALKNPPKTREQYLETLRKQGLGKTVEKILDLCQ